jgi:hypothetical protein
VWVGVLTENCPFTNLLENILHRVVCLNFERFSLTISMNPVMQYSIVWMIYFSTTIELSEKNYRSTKFTVLCLENLDAKKHIFFRSWDSYSQVRTIKKRLFYRGVLNLKILKNIFP